MHVVWLLLLGVHRGRYFLLTGQKISAEEAPGLGIVGEVLPKGQLMARARVLADEFAKKPPLALRYTRVALTQHLKRAMQDLLGYGLVIEGLGVIDAQGS